MQRQIWLAGWSAERGDKGCALVQTAFPLSSVPARWRHGFGVFSEPSISPEEAFMSRCKLPDDHAVGRSYLKFPPVGGQSAAESSPACGVVMTCLVLRQPSCLWDWFDEVGSCASAFCLSFFAMTLGALLRLLLFGVCLKGGARNADPLLRTSRSLCRGCNFAFLVEAWLLPVCSAGPPGTHLGPNLVDEVLENQLASFSDYQRFRVESCGHHSVTGSPRRAPLLPDPVDVVNVDDAFEEPDEQRIAIRVLTYQQEDHYMTMWLSPDSTADDMVRRVTAAMTGTPGEFAVHPADPQLADDVVTFSAVPAWWRFSGRTDVIFDQLEIGGNPFLALLPAEPTLADVYEAFGKIPPEGMRFYLQNEVEPIPRHGAFRITAGAVIKLRGEGPTLTEALEDLYWIRDLEQHGVPMAPSATNRLLVITPEESTVLQRDPEWTPLQVLHASCEAFGLTPSLNFLILCRMEIPSIAFNGEPFDNMVAIMPKSWMQRFPRCTAVFIDARELGEGIDCHIFDSNLVHPSEVIGLLECHIPEGVLVRVSGTDGAVDDGGKHRIQNDSILTLWTELREDSCSSSAAALTGAESSSEDTARDPWARPFYLIAAVHTLQTSTHYLRISIIPEDDEGPVAEELELTLFEHDQWHFLVMVRPQPCTPYIAAITESTWTRMMGLQPIMVDMTPVNGRCFAEFCEQEFRLDDVIRIVGDEWQPEWRVFVPDEAEALYPGSSYSAQRGMLISICPGEGIRPAYQTLQQRLLRPQTWASTDARDSLIHDPLHLHTALLVGDFLNQSVLEMPRLGNWFDVREVVATSIDKEAAQIRVATTATTVRELAVQGRRLTNVLGVALEERAG